MLNDFFYVVSYLHDLDIAMEKLNRVYKRYVDYFIIMTKIKHKLWKTIKIVKHILNKLNLAEHLDNITEEYLTTHMLKLLSFLESKYAAMVY